MKGFIIAIFLSILFVDCNKIDSDIKTLKVNKTTISETLNFKTISKALENETDLHSIDIVGWKKFPYQPKVDFRIAHIDSLIIIEILCK